MAQSGAVERLLVEAQHNVDADDLGVWFLDCVVRQKQSETPVVLRKRADTLGLAVFDDGSVTQDTLQSKTGVMCQFYFGGKNASHPLMLGEKDIYTIELQFWYKERMEDEAFRIIYNIILSNAMYSPGLYDSSAPFAFLQSDHTDAKVHAVFDRVAFESGRSDLALAGVTGVFTFPYLKKLQQYSQRTVTQELCREYSTLLQYEHADANRDMYQ